jgi:hypothetical protein
MQRSSGGPSSQPSLSCRTAGPEFDRSSEIVFGRGACSAIPEPFVGLPSQTAEEDESFRRRLEMSENPIESTSKFDASTGLESLGCEVELLSLGAILV